MYRLDNVSPRLSDMHAVHTILIVAIVVLHGHTYGKDILIKYDVNDDVNDSCRY